MPNVNASVYKTGIGLLSLLLSAAGCKLAAQNQPPSITNLDLQVDTVQHEVRVAYDLSDAENDSVAISLRASPDSGRSFRVRPAQVSGDVGYPVMPGTGKSLTWQYQPDSLAPMQGGYVLRLIADDRQTPTIQEVVDQVDSTRLRQHLSQLVGPRLPHGSAADSARWIAVRHYLDSVFSAEQLAVRRQPFTNQGFSGVNVIGRQRGTTQEDSVLYLTGHFDSVDGSPGADDNGSAVAGMLVAAEVLSDYRFAKSIKYVGFDMEEEGLLGSARYVSQGLPAYDDVVGQYNLEMIGYYSKQDSSQAFPTGFDLIFPEVHDSLQANQFRGDFITNVGTDRGRGPRLYKTFEAAAAQYVPQLKVYSTPLPPNESNWILLSDLLRSDHASFLYNGYPAVMLTDGSEFRNPHYHLASDTMGTLNYRFAANVTKATVGAIAELAGLQHSSTAESEAFKLDAPTTTERPASMPSRQAAFRLYPNPTGGRLTLAADLPQGQRLRVALYDHHGRHLGQLLDRRVAAGAQHWQLALPDAVGHRLSSGLYIVRIHGEHTSRSLRLMLR